MGQKLTAFKCNSALYQSDGPSGDGGSEGEGKVALNPTYRIFLNIGGGGGGGSRERDG